VPALNMHRLQRVATTLNRVVPNVLPLRQRQMETWRSKPAHGPTGRQRTADTGAIKINAARFASSIMPHSVRKHFQRRDGPRVHPRCLHNRAILDGDLVVRGLARSHREAMNSGDLRERKTIHPFQGGHRRREQDFDLRQNGHSWREMEFYA